MMSADAPDEWMTVKEVAAWLKVSTRTIERWAEAESTLPGLRVGGVLRFRRRRLEQWLRAHELGGSRSKKQARSAPNPAPAQEATTS